MNTDQWARNRTMTASQRHDLVCQWARNLMAGRQNVTAIANAAALLVAGRAVTEQQARDMVRDADGMVTCAVCCRTDCECP